MQDEPNTKPETPNAFANSDPPDVREDDRQLGKALRIIGGSAVRWLHHTPGGTYTMAGIVGSLVELWELAHRLHWWGLK